MGKADFKIEAIECIRHGEFERAAQLLNRFCRLHPEDADGWFLLGAIHGQTGRLREAIQCSRKALELKPGHADAAFNLGQAYSRLSRYREAERYFSIVVQLRPRAALAFDALGYALQEQGRYEEAKAAYCQALEIDPGLEGTRYLLAALEGGEEVPPQAPAEYVRGLFDGFADHFEEKLIDQLGYKTPWVIQEAVEKTLRDGAGALEILDIGCGTGLCGEALAPLARRLVGVDLSPRMIDLARQKGIYQSLHVADIVEFMQAGTARFDLVVAGDVFVYLGDLQPVFGAVMVRLKPGGVFAFSTESLVGGDTGYRLRRTNRYAHSSQYIQRLAGEFGLDIRDCREVVLRIQKGKPVAGEVWLLGVGKGSGG